MWALVPLQENMEGIVSFVVHLFERPPING
jgi:hypothetical protein